MTIILYPYDPNGTKYDYSFAMSIRTIENGKTYEIVDQGHRTHWFSVKEYSLEVTK